MGDAKCSEARGSSPVVSIHMGARGREVEITSAMKVLRFTLEIMRSKFRGWMKSSAYKTLWNITEGILKPSGLYWKQLLNRLSVSRTDHVEIEKCSPHSPAKNPVLSFRTFNNYPRWPIKLRNSPRNQSFDNDWVTSTDDGHCETLKHRDVKNTTVALNAASVLFCQTEPEKWPLREDTVVDL